MSGFRNWCGMMKVGMVRLSLGPMIAAPAWRARRENAHDDRDWFGGHPLKYRLLYDGADCYSLRNVCVAM